LLLADPACFPLDATDPALTRMVEGEDARCVKHLVALEPGGEGTKEYVEADSSGRIRGISRLYDSVTWPFGSGVACSLVPVVCLRVSYELPLGALPRLRRVLSMEGVPSRDVPLERGAANLGTEGGLLAMNERVVLALARAPDRSGPPFALQAAADARVHPDATLIGPVVLQAGAQVDEGATIVGPAVIGPGGRVGRYATLAQSVVGAGQEVEPGSSLRHRVFLGEPDDPDAGFDGREAERPEVHMEWDSAALALSDDVPRGSSYSLVKRAFDATAAALGLLVLSPLAALLAALVRIESKGPVVYGHVREGMGGKPFRCLKYRTMVSGADVQQRKLAELNQMDGPQFKVAQDPRRTRVGRFLTKTNLDEIPQLWNVLSGEMSLVGPRPSPFRENQICVPWREARLSVRPGITGLWQVCRHDRDKGDFHQWIYYDLLYVRNMSFWLDLKILVLTLLSFVKGGYIPLSWLLAPEEYGERRATPREPEPAAGPSTAEPSGSATDPALLRDESRVGH
jgi:lipopolysaccharide/colanic/teichoic acid biosynthesis glycosyltransferase